MRLLLEQDIKSGYIYSSLNLRVINLHDFVSTNRCTARRFFSPALCALLWSLGSSTNRRDCRLRTVNQCA